MHLKFTVSFFSKTLQILMTNNISKRRKNSQFVESMFWSDTWIHTFHNKSSKDKRHNHIHCQGEVTPWFAFRIQSITIVYDHMLSDLTWQIIREKFQKFQFNLTPLFHFQWTDLQQKRAADGYDTPEQNSFSTTKVLVKWFHVSLKPKNEISVIYKPSCYSKPVCIPFFYRTQKTTFWKMLVLTVVNTDFNCMGKRKKKISE